MFKSGDLIWYKSWASNEYTVEIVDVYEDRVRCEHTDPKYKGKGKGFIWFFGPTELVGMKAANLLDWISDGKAVHHQISREPDWEV